MTIATEVVCREAAVHEQDALAKTLAAAFEDDPVFGWLLRDRRTREERLRRFFAIELRHMAFAHGTVWTSQDLSGAAICMPPGAWQLPPRLALTQAPAFGRVFGRRLPMATAFQ